MSRYIDTPILPDRIDILNKYAEMFEQTFDWGCNDRVCSLFCNFR